MSSYWDYSDKLDYWFTVSFFATVLDCLTTKIVILLGGYEMNSFWYGLYPGLGILLFYHFITWGLMILLSVFLIRRGMLNYSLCPYKGALLS